MEFFDRQHFSKYWSHGEIIKEILGNKKKNNGNHSRGRIQEATWILLRVFQCVGRHDPTATRDTGADEEEMGSLLGGTRECKRKAKQLKHGSSKEECVSKIQDNLGRCESKHLLPNVCHAGPKFQHIPSQCVRNTCIIHQSLS